MHFFAFIRDFSLSNSLCIDFCEQSPLRACPKLMLSDHPLTGRFPHRPSHFLASRLFLIDFAFFEFLARLLLAFFSMGLCILDRPYLFLLCHPLTSHFLAFDCSDPQVPSKPALKVDRPHDVSKVPRLFRRPLSLTFPMVLGLRNSSARHAPRRRQVRTEPALKHEA